MNTSTAIIIPRSNTTCKRCHANIVLACRLVTSRTGHYILMSRTGSYSWKCCPTDEMPVRVHIPETYVNEDGEPCHEVPVAVEKETT